jgi:hypothetical protein
MLDYASEYVQEQARYPSRILAFVSEQLFLVAEGHESLNSSDVIIYLSLRGKVRWSLVEYSATSLRSGRVC